MGAAQSGLSAGHTHARNPRPAHTAMIAMTMVTGSGTSMGSVADGARSQSGAAVGAGGGEAQPPPWTSGPSLGTRRRAPPS